jgi:hypothetical protein
MRRTITKAERLYLENNINETPQQLAEDLGWTENQVKVILFKLKNNSEPVIEGKMPEPPIKPGKLFAQRKDRGVVAMTGGESEVSDEFTEYYEGNKVLLDKSDHIYRRPETNE